MHDLDLVVPSVLLAPILASDLLRDQTMPNLGRVLARADASETFALPPRASLSPWQAWVFGRGSGSAGGETAEVNIAELWAMACGLAPSRRGGRFVVEPAHFKVANDHLRLDDPGVLDVTLAEARALASAIEPVLVEAGWRLEPIEPVTLRHWFVTRDDDVSLSGAAIERAIGDNVAEWQPRAPEETTDRAAGDAAALAWRRCVNEVQMLWFGHPVNEARELAGKPTINTLWLSGNGAPPAPLPHYAAVDSGLPLLAALSIEPEAPRKLESFDGFIEPERRGDWSGWREQLATLDERIGGVLREQSDKAVGAATFVFCGRDEARTVVLGARDGAKFWRGWGRKPSFEELLTATGA